MKEMKRQPGVMFYDDMLHTINLLPEHDARIMMLAIESYHLLGEEPKPEGNMMYLWPMFEQRLNNDSQRYGEKCNKNRINGLISSFKRIYAPRNNINPEDMNALGEFLLSRGITEEEIVELTGITFSQRSSANVSELNQYQ